MYTIIVNQEINVNDISPNSIRLTIYDNESIVNATWERPIIFKLNENKQWICLDYYIETNLLRYLIENNYIKSIKNKEFLDRPYDGSKHTLELNNSVLLQVL
jgi:hypothetical protein